MRFQYVKYVVLLLLVFLLSSCLGVKTNIDINNDGSGTIDLVYTISETFDSLGQQDGNLSQPPVPVSKSDFEKTISQIEGLSLKSYKSESDGENILVTVKLGFDNLTSLTTFFDESGQLVSYTEANGKRELVFRFNDAPGNSSASEQELFTKALEGYMFEFSVKTRGNVEAAFIDQNGNTLQNVSIGNFEVQNNSVSYEVPIADLVFAKEPVILKIGF
jgi:hypothetical protein